MRPRPRVAAEASGAILEVPVRSRVIAPIRPTAAAMGIAPLPPTVATPAEAVACPVIAPARRTAAAMGTAPLPPTVATPAEAAACPVIAPARRPAAAGTAPLLPREGALAVVAAVPAAAEALTADAASTAIVRFVPRRLGPGMPGPAEAPAPRCGAGASVCQPGCPVSKRLRRK